MVGRRILGASFGKRYLSDAPPLGSYLLTSSSTLRTHADSLGEDLRFLCQVLFEEKLQKPFE